MTDLYKFIFIEIEAKTKKKQRFHILSLFLRRHNLITRETVGMLGTEYTNATKPYAFHFSKNFNPF